MANELSRPTYESDLAVWMMSQGDSVRGRRGMPSAMISLPINKEP